MERIVDQNATDCTDYLLAKKVVVSVITDKQHCNTFSCKFTENYWQLQLPVFFCYFTVSLL